MEIGIFVAVYSNSLETKGAKRAEGPSYRGRQLHNNSNLILEPHLFAI
jgi:hypothetical protein